MTENRTGDSGNGCALFAGNVWSSIADDYRTEVARDLRQWVQPLIEESEEGGRFPRSILRQLGQRNHFRRRWNVQGPVGDTGAAIIFAEELGRLLAGGISAGVSLHGDSALCLLRAARDASEGAALRLERGLSGEEALCIAVTEPATGSDPSMISTSATELADGWRLDGRKKFISMARSADTVLVLARTSRTGNQLSFFAVPTSAVGFEVVRDLKKHGTHSIETCELNLNGIVIPSDALVGRRGAGLLLFSRAMTCERLALCAQLVGAFGACLDIVWDYLQCRPARSGALWNFQALRHRYADQFALHLVMRRAVVMTAFDLQHGSAGPRDIAALKLFIAPRVEDGLSEVMQMAGGVGYLADLPIERALRDVRLARIGAGTDDIMRELVADGRPRHSDALMARVQQSNPEAFEGVIQKERVQA